MKQRRGIRRFVIRAGIFLLLGAIVNIAVAWGCAITLPNQRDNWTMDFGVTRLSGDWAWFVNRHSRPGFLRINSIVTQYLQDDGGVWPNPGTFIEPWSRIPSYGDLTVETEWIESAGGWPLQSMWQRFNVAGNLRTDEAQFGAVSNVRRDRVEHGCVVRWHLGSPKTILPLAPIWPGFAINTLFYAAILWLLLALPGALRRWRRLKRGLCPACAYPVGTSDLCTECGMPVTRPA